MNLILNILDNNSAEWILVDEIEKKHRFAMQQGQENILAELDVFLGKEKVKLGDIDGLGLAIKQASLTQVKVQVTIINTLGWQLNISTVADFYYKDDLKIEGLVTQIKKQKHFQAIKPEYQREAEITISKKTPKFTISK
ncbi:hypothetical protein HOD19_01935 [bacterium]|jgi:hypothetical protein|nr:hypothetical protein [bacterium]MBT4648997.1 hypothetical protein [bacterium]